MQYLQSYTPEKLKIFWFPKKSPLIIKFPFSWRIAQFPRNFTMPWCVSVFKHSRQLKERLKISEYLYFEMSSLGSSKPYPCKHMGPQLRLWANGGHRFQKFRCRQLKLSSQKQVFLTLLLKIQNSSYGEIKWDWKPFPLNAVTVSQW